MPTKFKVNVKGVPQVLAKKYGAEITRELNRLEGEIHAHNQTLHRMRNEATIGQALTDVIMRRRS